MDTVESAIHRTVPTRVQSRRDPRQNTVINVIWRAAVLIVGLCLIGLGVALLVLPGPGWGAILLGLVVLASEYTWANRLLAPVRSRMKQEAARLRRRSRGQQVALAMGTAVLALTLVGFGIWYVNTYGWALPG